MPSLALTQRPGQPPAEARRRPISPSSAASSRSGGKQEREQRQMLATTTLSSTRCESGGMIDGRRTTSWTSGRLPFEAEKRFLPRALSLSNSLQGCLIKGTLLPGSFDPLKTATRGQSFFSKMEHQKKNFGSLNRLLSPPPPPPRVDLTPLFFSFLFSSSTSKQHTHKKTPTRMIQTRPSPA